jgi:bacillithiol biosynthesis cysteine-adding enzyme BshC
MISALQEIDWNKTGLLSPLISDYLAQKKELARLYKYPFSYSSFSEVIGDKSKDNTDRKLLVDVLKSQYAKLPVHDKVNRNIELLWSDKTFTVVASHQPVLFLGPLYNIYKIASAIQLATGLKGDYPQYDFVPVFWLGSEDHDTEELNHVYINGNKIEWKEAGSGASGRWKTDTLKPLLEQLKSTNSDQVIINLLENGLKQFSTFGRLTQYLVHELFKEHGLIVIDQNDAGFKKKFAPVIQDEILNSTASAVLKSNIEFLESSYKPQAKPREINFFYLGEGFRERIIYNPDSGKFEVNNTALSFTRESIISEIENHPERFSPNVILRPLFQEMILPNLAFIGGAGELSYWLELKPLFEHYKVNYPMLVLRSSAVIISTSIQKKLEKLNLSVVDFFQDVEVVINQYVRQNISAEAHLNGEKAKLDEVFDLISSKAIAADPTLKQSVAAEKQKALAILENIESKILKAEKRKQETAVNQIRSIHAALFPGNEPQERREGFTAFYGDNFINEVVQQTDAFKKAFSVLLNS